MATVTPNFNWPVPTSTDLVKDGATAIEALGDSIDGSLVDLKGGTTGQVLSKTSGTDMDFTWVTTDDANAIQNSIVDAKGDLISATANDTPARLAVGNNGETLVADSSTSTGLRYQGHIEAGKNALINGGMDIWQRGTSSTTNLVYLADRWFNYTSAGTTTFSRESSIVPTGSQYSMKIAQASASATITVNQAVETLNAVQYAGQTVSVSMMCYASTSTAMQIQVGYSTSTDVSPLGTWTNITASSGGTATVTNAWQKMIGTYAIPSTAKSLYISLYIPTLTATTNAYFGQAMMELGSVPTQFSRTGGTIQGELAACQRYLPSVMAAGNTWLGYATATNNSYTQVSYPVQARVAPTGISVPSLAGNFTLFAASGGSGTPTAINFDSAGVNSALIQIITTVGSPTLAAGTTTALRGASGSSYILFTGCEL
jgi:hypothetical protein